jgi:HSP20 family protein
MPNDRADVRMLRDEMRSLFSDLPSSGLHDGESPVAVDVVDRPDSVVIRIDMLGFAPDELEVEVEGDMLRLRGSRIIEVDQGTPGTHRTQRKRWHFVRGIQLPAILAPQSAEARHVHGLLTITVDKRPR